MRILHVNMSLDPVTGGGTAERTLQLARQLAHLRHDCTILTIACGVARPYSSDDRSDYLNIVRLPCFNQRFYIPKFKASEILRLVDDADITHLMGHWTFLNALVFRYAQHLKKPYVVCPAGALPIFGRSRILKHAYNALVGRRLVRKARAHVAIADNELPQYAEYGIRPDHITKIPNGVNLQDYQQFDVGLFRSRAGLGTAPYILFVGRLNLIKGPDILLNAFRETVPVHPECHLVFAGPDGGMETSLRGMAEEMGVQDRVHFIGYVGGAEKTSAYRGASFVVVPSRQEAMSIVVLEAGICGKAVLISDLCGFSASDRIEGIHVVSSTEAGIRDGLLDLLHDSGQTNEMGERLKQYVEENYTWELMARRYVSLFQEVLQH